MLRVSGGGRDRINPWTYVLLVLLLIPFLFPLGWMFLRPGHRLPPALEQLSEPAGWLAGATAFAAALWFCRPRQPALTPHVVAVGGVGLAQLAATLAGRLSSE